MEKLLLRVRQTRKVGVPAVRGPFGGLVATGTALRRIGLRRGGAGNHAEHAERALR